MRVLVRQNYTEYITNTERVNWPISASKLFLTILSFITSCIVLNWENQAVSVLCVKGVNHGSGKGYKVGRSHGIGTKTSELPLPTPNNIENWAKCRWKRGLYGCNIAGAERRMEGWTQFKPNDKLSLTAEYMWTLVFFYSVPCSSNLILIHKLFPCPIKTFPIWFLQKQSHCLALTEKTSEEYVLDPEAQNPDWSDMTRIL